MPYDEWREFLNIPKEQFDVVLLLGDIEINYLKDIAHTFSDKLIFGVQGNHDYPVDLESYDLLNLHGKTINERGLDFLGIEGCVRYKEGKRPMHSQDDIISLLSSFPRVDVVLSHNSPKGIHDSEKYAHEGYIGLTYYIENYQPSYVFHGHQHENVLSKKGSTLIVGVFGGVVFDFSNQNIQHVLSVDDL